ncbi:MULTISPECIES: riboflavin synthase [Leuconostoc]|uniref:Riboflavin synthase n=2 Tax=Leuconostoc kimchii TaxID=136609 RepID=D5T4S1_LEUKI|nr:MULTISPECIES: riboflavin synthase [Leuconostoc]ADG41542.1 riboflavin synthase subunit alpha [Leuconostoc kimchii IMSNU 11154]AEJ30540.1 riboflavin synthase subunit alpha [Leuconostoc sp. C2]QBR47659.1 riboflavin synthase [Leuconostoc kimchii]
MFTGITQNIGQLENMMLINDKNMRLRISTETNYFSDSALGASIMVDGVCLTMIASEQNYADFDIMMPTFETTIVQDYRVGQRVNLEKAILASERFDGHFVLGHVDTTAQVIHRQQVDETVMLTFQVGHNQVMRQIVAKGSITISGVSLTVVKTVNDTFQIGLIPYTLTHTNLDSLEVTDRVNIETDILAKYLNQED